MKKNRVLFVGSNPSEASPDQSAFHRSTRSYKVLDKWIENLAIEASYANVCNKQTVGNRPLKDSEVDTGVEGEVRRLGVDRVVALGKTAAKVLTKLKIEHLEMPHPSGRNRLLNDPEYVKAKVEALRKYVE